MIQHVEKIVPKVQNFGMEISILWEYRGRNLHAPFYILYLKSVAVGKLQILASPSTFLTQCH